MGTVIVKVQLVHTEGTREKEGVSSLNMCTPYTLFC